MHRASTLSTSSEVAASPSFNDVEGFLSAISKWLQQANARLTCAAQSTKLNYTLEVVTAFHAHAHGAPSEWVADGSKRALLESADTMAASNAVLSMQLWVLCSLLVLAGLWYIIVKLLSWTMPGLQVLWRRSRLREGLRRSQKAIQRDVLLRGMTGAYRQRAGQHQLYTACMCTAVASLLVMLLLSVDVWTGLLMCKVWEVVTSPISNTWTRVSALSSSLPLSVPSWIGAAMPLSLAASELLAASHVPQAVTYVPYFIRQIVQQLQAMYFWHLVGSVVLGLALWLLQFAHHRMHTYNASIPFITSRSTEPQLLHQLDEAEERRRNREIRRLQIATMRQNELLLERMREVERGTAFLLEVQQSAAPFVGPLEDAAAAATETSDAEAAATATPTGMSEGQYNTETFVLADAPANADVEAQRSAAPVAEVKEIESLPCAREVPRVAKRSAEDAADAADEEELGGNTAAV
ncbi:hypothetical protein ABL78_2325 [Leptomonas seymouri]|uniref:Uncharacterized protein n=1 Tax=Leptomonas seymouri TaxID=5684 RepID=A0A0N1I690_LEPSE|nr:hypothetical protein ABL78_2325 [Leptomonas seymouri]|eukprot:KPI88592.1 hypothetical protein ABL78_2325 [Leptomonas seymouri]